MYVKYPQKKKFQTGTHIVNACRYTQDTVIDQVWVQFLCSSIRLYKPGSSSRSVSCSIACVESELLYLPFSIAEHSIQKHFTTHLLSSYTSRDNC